MRDIQEEKAKFERFNDNVLRFAPWSYSKLSKLYKCPLAFTASYLFKLPEGSYEPFRYSAQKEGTAAHEILEKLLEMINDGLIVGDVDAFLETQYDLILDDVAKNMVLLQVEIDNLQLMKNQAIGFLKKIIKLLDNFDGTIMSIEGKMAIDRHFNGCAFDTDYTRPRQDQAIFRGLFDLCMIQPGEKVILVDHKCGNYSPFISKSIRDQFGTYLAMLMLAFPKLMGDVPIFSAKMNVVKYEKIEPVGNYSQKYILDTLVPNWISNANETADMLEDDIFLKGPDLAKMRYDLAIARNDENIPAKSCSICKYCEFKTACKKDKNLQTLLIEKGKPKYPGIKIGETTGNVEKCKGSAKLEK